MVSFTRVAAIVVSLHSNRNSKIGRKQEVKNDNMSMTRVVLTHRGVLVKRRRRSGSTACFKEGARFHEGCCWLPPDKVVLAHPWDSPSLGLSCWAAHCASWVLQLGRTVGCCSPLAACRTPSNTKRDSPQGKCVQVSSSSILPNPV